jgi:hypothetical protein
MQLPVDSLQDNGAAAVCILTIWNVQKLSVVQLVKKLVFFYGTRRFITVFMKNFRQDITIKGSTNREI